jgi:hypothetical protein
VYTLFALSSESECKDMLLLLLLLLTFPLVIISTVASSWGLFVCATTAQMIIVIIISYSLHQSSLIAHVVVPLIFFLFNCKQEENDQGKLTTATVNWPSV